MNHTLIPPLDPIQIRSRDSEEEGRRAMIPYHLVCPDFFPDRKLPLRIIVCFQHKVRRSCFCYRNLLLPSSAVMRRYFCFPNQKFSLILSICLQHLHCLILQAFAVEYQCLFRDGTVCPVFLYPGKHLKLRIRKHFFCFAVVFLYRHMHPGSCFFIAENLRLLDPWRIKSILIHSYLASSVFLIFFLIFAVFQLILRAVMFGRLLFPDQKPSVFRIGICNIFQLIAAILHILKVSDLFTVRIVFISP